MNSELVMNWTETVDGFEATPVPGCVANIRHSRTRGAIHWKLTLTGRSGSAISAQSRLESIIDRLGVEVDPKDGRGCGPKLAQLSQLEQAGGEVWVREGGKHESVQ